MPEPKVQRVEYTPRYLDKQRDPWEYVTDELPTTTIYLKGVARRVVTRAPLGTAAEGSYRITGSHYDFSRGTYSLRIVRLSLSAVGSVQGANSGTVVQWHLRHSRSGTIDVKVLSPTPRSEGAPGVDRVDLIGDRMRPIYAVGPGTLYWGWDTFKGELGSRMTLTQSMEAIPG